MLIGLEDCLVRLLDASKKCLDALAALLLARGALAFGRRDVERRRLGVALVLNFAEYDFEQFKECLGLLDALVSGDVVVAAAERVQQ